MSEKDIALDYRGQLVDLEKSITENELILTDIEAGPLRRLLAGKGFWVLCGVLWVTTIALVVFALWFDVHSYFDMPTSSLIAGEVGAGLTQHDVSTINLFVKMSALGIAFLAFLVAVMLFDSRSNLVKQNKLADYLNKSLHDRERRREILIKYFVEMNGGEERLKRG